MTDNPYPPGSPEAAEWAAIAAAPSAHTPAPMLAPDDPAHLGELAAYRFELGDDAAQHDHTRSLSASGVLYGPDCSQYQGKPDWHAVRASGCVIGGYKVSEGRTFLDPSHAWNRGQTKANGLQPLAYHYLYYSDEYAADPSLWARQAEWFVRNADPDAIHVLDVEAPATSGHHLGVREWVARYRQLLPRHGLGLYANRALWENRSRMPYSPAGLFDFVWHAGVGNGYYTSATGSIAHQWSAQGSLVNSFAGQGYPYVKLWQITDHAQVPGVGGSFCDGNAFIGTLTELRALTGQTGDDDMSAEDVAAIKAYIDSKLDDIARAVWSKQITSEWNGQARDAEELLARAEQYSIEGGYPYGRPDGNAHAGTPTHAALLAAALKTISGQTDTLETSESSQAAQLQQLSGGLAGLPDALAAKLTSGLQVQGVDYAHIRQLLDEGLAEHLASLRVVTDTTAPSA